MLSQLAELKKVIHFKELGSLNFTVDITQRVCLGRGSNMTICIFR